MKSKFYVKGYEITCHVFGGIHFSQQSFEFSALINGEVILLDTKFENELVMDLCYIMGLDPEEELENIAIEEIKKEFEKRNIK